MHVGLFVKREDRAQNRADEFEDWLLERGVVVHRRVSPRPGPGGISPAPTPTDLHCVFVLGGDGTFLSAARWVGARPIPLLGIKFGQVGFLAEAPEDRMYEVAARVLEGRFSVVHRTRLRVEVARDGVTVASGMVLNEVVINKGALARLARIEACVNGRYLTTFRADGLVIATPTGSTAYSLAAGGPVLHPRVPAFLLTPICPFTLTNRPLIIPDTACVLLKLDPDSRDVMLTLDGQAGMPITDADIIAIQKSRHPVRTIEMPDLDYFDMLKQKLHWSGGRG